MDKFINYTIRVFYRIVSRGDVGCRVGGRVGLCMGGILGHGVVMGFWTCYNHIWGIDGWVDWDLAIIG